MSPSWRDRVVVFLAPGEVRVQRWRRGFRPQAEPVQKIACDAAGRGAACLPALREALQALPRRGFDARVVLSNQFVRYALVPDAHHLRGDAERTAAARHALAATYGEAARQWEVATDQSGAWTTLLAAGLDAGLPQAIASVLKEAGARGMRIEPLLAVACNRSEKLVTPRTGWLAVVEADRIVLAALGAAGIRALRSQRLRGAAPGELAILVDQSRLLDEPEAGRTEVLVAGEELTHATAADGLQLRPALLNFTGA